MTSEPHFGSCEIVAEIGSGTLATVYKAISQPLGRKVAIKALKPTISPDSSFAAPLEREARVLSELFHPNVALLLDFVKNKEQMYLVLEYISGFSLAQVLAKKNKHKPEVVAAIGAQVALGLSHVHERGVVHRDIKPANLIIDKRGVVKLVDFGIAHRDRLPTADEPLTESPEPLFGTPAYMAPEQLLGDVVVPASDLFSLGVVLYQCLAGARPFDRDGEAKDESKRATGVRTRREPPVPLRVRVPDVPRALERVIMRCLEKDPDERPASAQVVAQELLAFSATRSDASPEELAQSALVSARLRTGDALRPRAAASLVDARPPVWQSPLSLAAFGIALVVGLAAIRSASHETPTALANEGPLGVAPAAAGEVRVLATPWAEVAVDGQPIDVTPMARPIRLSPGVHYVSFTHPAAKKPETRRVDVEPGESLVLDVTMGVATPDAGARADGAVP